MTHLVLYPVRQWNGMCLIRGPPSVKLILLEAVGRLVYETFCWVLKKLVILATVICFSSHGTMRELQCKYRTRTVIIKP